jgi:pimeloyl-ACP methyl ester carboxylesterase
MTRLLLLAWLVVAAPAMAQPAATTADITTRVTHGYASSNGVRIHYAALGDARKPLMVLIHGFPDFWYTWRHQMAALSNDYYTVAIDQRGYNLSDKPDGVANYVMPLLVYDVVAVIKSLGREKAIVVGHDWGGAVAWSVAMARPEVVEQLIILNLPHLRALRRELVNNPQQAANSQYARNFQRDNAARYVAAFKQSSIEGMLNYYKANYPREPYTLDTTPLVKVKAPVLMIHGLTDRYLLAAGLNGTWEFVDNSLTIVTVPNAGHFVQHEATDVVTRTMRMWLRR